MYYLLAKFGGDIPSGFVLVLSYTHNTHTRTHTYRANELPTPASDYIGVSNNIHAYLHHEIITCLCAGNNNQLFYAS